MSSRYPKHLTADLIAYEDGQLRDENIRELFQYLVDSKLAWTLQGQYGRTAEALITAGLIEA
jgi:hypothetical protein